MEIRDPAQPPGARKYQQEQLYKLAPKLHDHCCNYGGTTVSLCSTRMKSGADFSYSFTGCLMSDALIFRDLMNEVLKGGKRKILSFSGMARKGLTKEMACGHIGGGGTFLQSEYHIEGTEATEA